MSLKLFLGSTNDNHSGFTIIETMIALTIFSVIFLVIIEGVSEFYSTFYKSTIITSTQNSVRNIDNALEQEIESSSSSPAVQQNIPYNPSTNTPGYFCVNGQEFVYFIGDVGLQSTNEFPMGYSSALYEMPETPSGMCDAPSGDTGGTSLIGYHYRLVAFTITNLASPSAEWLINLKIAYTSGGTNDLGDDALCSPSIRNSCSSSTSILSKANYSNSDITCKGGLSLQFCYVDQLQSIVDVRLE